MRWLKWAWSNTRFVLRTGQKLVPCVLRMPHPIAWKLTFSRSWEATFCEGRHYYDPHYFNFWFISLIQYNGQRNRNKGEKEMSPKILYRKLQIYHDEPLTCEWTQVVLIDMMFLINFEEFTDTHSLTLNYVF